METWIGYIGPYFFSSKMQSHAHPFWFDKNCDRDKEYTHSHTTEIYFIWLGASEESIISQPQM